MPLVGKKIETTNDNFGDRVRKDYLLVDKTLMIKEFWNGQDISLITRARRFGKTLNMSMLQHFFAAEVKGKSTEGLFNKFAIAQVDNGEFLQQHQGKHPVIFISFKDIKETSYEAAVKQIRVLMEKLYREHKHLLKSDKIDEDDKREFKKYLDGSANNEELQDALRFLSEFLYRAHGNKGVIVLIDEYDSPLTSAYEHKFLDKLSDFLRTMFSAALKTNPFLEKGLMTGILRVSQNSMLSGLNNLEVYTVVEGNYQSYFGFTEDEVTELLKTENLPQSMKQIADFYNGYKINGTVIYNPLSVMQFLSKKELKPYWVLTLTSNDKILKDVLLNSSDEAKKLLGDLIQGKTIEGEINPNLRYEDLVQKPTALWTLLLFCGYLTIESSKLSSTGMTYLCQLRIPNDEVVQQYIQIFSEWLKEKMGDHYDSFLKHLVEGKVEEFTKELGEYLMQSLSFRDVGGDKKSERFYHGFVAGLVASLRTTHYLDSNKESGFGLFDFMLTPKSPGSTLSIILEFKHVKTYQSPETEAKSALKQIDGLKYATDLQRYPHVKRVLKVGLAFCEKSVISAYREESISTRSNSDVILSQEYHRDIDIYDSGDNSQSSQGKVVASSRVEVEEIGELQKKSDDSGRSALASKKRGRAIYESHSDEDLLQEKSSPVVVGTSREDSEIPASKKQKRVDSSMESASEVLSEKGFFSSKEATDAQIPSSSGEEVVMKDTHAIQTKTKPT